MIRKKLLTTRKLIIFSLILAGLALIAGVYRLWQDKTKIAQKVVLKGYIDSVGRRGYQQKITVHFEGKEYTGFYFYVGPKNNFLDLDDSQTIALIEIEGKFIMEEVLDKEVEIKGLKKSGKICYFVGSGPYKYDPPFEEKCLQMPVVFVDIILDSQGSSLISEGTSCNLDTDCKFRAGCYCGCYNKNYHDKKLDSLFCSCASTDNNFPKCQCLNKTCQ